jgi:hypothetical protein
MYLYTRDEIIIGWTVSSLHRTFFTDRAHLVVKLLPSISLSHWKKKTSCVYPLLGTLYNPPSYVTTRVWMKAKAWAPLKKKSQSLYVFTIYLSVCVSIVSFSFAAVLIFLRPCISPVTYLDLDVGGQSRVPHV